MTRCVLLLLYGGLLHHQNIKCPVGKRACAWVHPHFTFTADCRLNRATFPRFLAPENVPVRPSRILSRSPSRSPLPHQPLPPSAPLRSVDPKRGHWLSPVASLFRPAAKFTPFLISQILLAASQLISSESPLSLPSGQRLPKRDFFFSAIFIR